MTQYGRITGKVFGGNATATGNDPQIAQFGSALANTFVGTTDPETIQSLPAWGQGWIGAVTPETQFPPLPEMTGAMKVLSHQICGILQQGVSTWDNGTIYYTGNFVSLNGRLYTSQVDENQGNNPATDTTNWQEFSSGGGLEIGDVAFTQMAIDESKGKRRKLNGQIIVQEQYQQLTNILKASIAQNPDMACTEQEWQAEVTMSTTGICYKFVVDDVGGTIRLPKYPTYFIGGINDIAPVAGNGMTLGLTSNDKNYGLQSIGYTPNYTINPLTMSQNTYGTDISSANTTAQFTGKTVGLTTDATKSGIEAQVSQEQIKGTYFIQVATGSETEDNIINEIELNNPFVLLEPKFFEAEVYNVSWLLANGAYNGSNAIHPSAYQALLVENNTEVAIGSTVTLPIGTEYTKRGLSVKLSTDSDIADYDYVVNTSDETFRCPLKIETNIKNGFDYTKGYAVSSSFTATEDGLVTYTLGTNAVGSASINGVTVLQKQIVGVDDNASLTQTFQCSKGDVIVLPQSGTFYPQKEVANTEYLYFYVGEVVQNANLVNVGRIEEIKANKTDVDGQWVMTKALTLASEVAVNKNTTELTYDLSDYLPNDGYNYEVIFEANALTGSTSGQYMFVRLLTDYAKAMGQGSGVYLCNNRTRSNSYVNMAGNAILPVGNGRSVTVGFYQTSDNFNGSFNLWVDGYRRLGKNV